MRKVPPALWLPPPAVLLLHGLLAWWLDDGLPMGGDFAGRERLALGVALAGALLMMIAGLAMLRRRTTVDPLHPADASALVTGGIFAISRNPIYLGDLLILCGWLLWLGNPLGLLVAASFVLWLTLLQIRHEEAALVARFGDDYRTYCRRVRRWL